MSPLLSPILWDNLNYKPVCLFDNFHSMFSVNSKVSRDVFKNKNERQLISTISTKLSPQCHMPSSMCHFNVYVSIDVWCFFLHKSHYMSKFRLCLSVDMHLILFLRFFACQISKTCKNFVKNTHCYKSYTNAQEVFGHSQSRSDPF